MKYLTFILLLLSISMLAADPVIYPTTTLAENFGATWCGACQFALDGLDVLDAETNNSEVVFARLLTESGDYTTLEIDARFGYYEVLGLPAVIFNGKTRVDGSGDGIADGSLYQDAMQNYLYLGSPIRMSMPTFVNATGMVSVDIEMLNPDLSFEDAKLIYYLIEDDIDDELTHIVRDIITQDIDIAYTGSVVEYDTTFDMDYSWNVNNLWAVAFVQLQNQSIIQSASSLPLPENLIQAALPFDNTIYGPANGQYESPAFYIYNLGAADSYTRHIEVISAPDDWYFNYCDIDGNCYPGSMQIPFTLGEGEYAAYDLNLSIGSDGIAYFNFVINSDLMGEYKIPFYYSTATANADALAPSTLSVVKAYPNPFSAGLNIEVESAKDVSTSRIEIFNIKGQKLKSIALKELRQGPNYLQVDLSELSNGVYFYRLEGSQSTGKLLKIK